MNKRMFIALVVLTSLALLFVGCAKKPAKETKVTETKPQIVTSKSGLRHLDLAVGKGEAVELGDDVFVHYTLWQDSKGQKGRKIDSSHDRGKSFSFVIGAREVIAGWDQGVAGMKEGGKRRLVIPPHLGYGRRGAGRQIPPNSTLVFDVELLRVE